MTLWEKDIPVTLTKLLENRFSPFSLFLTYQVFQTSFSPISRFLTYQVIHACVNLIMMKQISKTNSVARVILSDEKHPWATKVEIKSYHDETTGSNLPSSSARILPCLRLKKIKCLLFRLSSPLPDQTCDFKILAIFNWISQSIGHLFGWNKTRQKANNNLCWVVAGVPVHYIRQTVHLFPLLNL